MFKVFVLIVNILIISKKWKLEEPDFLDFIQGALCLTVVLFGTDCPNCAVLRPLTCNFFELQTDFFRNLILNFLNGNS